MTYEEISEKIWRKSDQLALIECALSIDKLKEENHYIAAMMCEGAIKELKRRGFNRYGEKLPYTLVPEEDPDGIISKLSRFWYAAKQWWYDVDKTKHVSDLIREEKERERKKEIELEEEQKKLHEQEETERIRKQKCEDYLAMKRAEEEMNRAVIHNDMYTECAGTSAFDISNHEREEIETLAKEKSFNKDFYLSCKWKGNRAFYAQRYVWNHFGPNRYDKLFFTWEKVGKHRYELVYHEFKDWGLDIPVSLHIKKKEEYLRLSHRWLDAQNHDVSFSMLDFCHLTFSFGFSYFELFPLVDDEDTLLKDGQRCFAIDTSPDAEQKVKEAYAKEIEFEANLGLPEGYRAGNLKD